MKEDTDVQKQRKAKKKISKDPVSSVCSGLGPSDGVSAHLDGVQLL